LDFGFLQPDMNEQEFKNRTKQIAIRVIRLVESLPVTNSAQIIGKQLLRSATSIGANYRAACRGKSTADVLHKLSIVEEEADESFYWLELLIESSIVSENKLSALMSDINEIVAMTVSSIKTLRSKTPPIQNPKSKIQNSIDQSKIQNLKSKI
jgi:four helix bundle protein